MTVGLLAAGSSRHRLAVAVGRLFAARHPAVCTESTDNGAVPLYRDEAIVLRTQKLGEADRIVTLLTRRLGKVRAVGKGVRRTK